MATMAEAKRRLTITVEDRGIEQTVAKLNQLSRAQGDVAVTAREQERATQSAERRLNSIQRQYDEHYRAQQALARVERDLAAAQSQGLITAQRRLQLLSMAAERHGLATAAINREILATERLTNVQRMQVAANQNVDGAQGRRQVLGYQAFDIGQGLAAGTPLAIIAAQQGPQIAQLYAGAGGLNALLKDTIGILGGVVRAAGPWLAVLAALYGAYKLITSSTAESALKIDSTTAALAAQAAPLATVESGIKELASLQGEYQKAIVSTASAQDAATQSIIANTEREYNAKKALLEIELKRQRASIAAQQAELAVSNLGLKRDLSQQVFTRSDLERQGFADPRVGSVPFVRLPDDVTGLEKTRELLEKNPLSDKIKELRANLDLTEMAATQLEEALKKTFNDAGGVGGPTFAGGAIPIPTFRGIDDMPGSVEFYRDLEKASTARVREMEAERDALKLTGAAAEAFRFEQEALSQAIAENIELAPDQIAGIKAMAAAYGVAAEAASRLRLNQDLAFERDQLFRTSGDQTIASRLRGAGLNVDFNSPEARQMRELQQIEEIRDGVKGFFTDFRAGLLQGDDIGKAFGNAILNALNKQLDKIAEQAFTHLGNAVASSLGLGGSTATGGSAIGLAGVAVSAIGGAANDNSVTRAPLADIGALSSKLAAGKASSHVTGMSADLQSALASFIADAPGDITINSGFRSVARQRELFDAAVAKYGSVSAARKWVAPPGRSQHNMGNAADLGFENSATRSWAHENAANYGLKFPMGHEPWHVETAGARSGTASQALDKLAQTSEAATKSLGGFAGGLGELGNALMSAGASGGGGGNWFSGLMSMFGGAGGAIGHMMSISPAATRHIAAGFGGLFANGGISDRPAIFGEGPLPEAAVPLPDGRRIPVEMRMPQMPRMSGGQVQVSVVSRFDANGNFESVVEGISQRTAGPIAEQTSQNTIGRYNYQQRTGGAQNNDHFFKRLKRRA